MKEKIKDFLPYLIILVVVILFRTFIATPIKVDGMSMYPTLEGNEIMILNKLGKIQRYNIVVVKEETEDLIKRVIGLPNETIEIVEGNIYINGKKIEENYGKGETSDYPKTKLKSDEYFVLGDNRENSKDSRSIGPVKKKQIKGNTSFIIFPFTRFGNTK